MFGKVAREMLLRGSSAVRQAGVILVVVLYTTMSVYLFSIIELTIQAARHPRSLKAANLVGAGHYVCISSHFPLFLSRHLL